MSRAIHEAGQYNAAAVLEWREAMPPSRVLRAVGCSIAIHLLAAAIFVALPDTHFRYATPLIVDVRKSIPLVLPRDLLVTQRDPNEGKVKQQLEIRSSLPTRPSPPRAFQAPAPPGPAGPQEPAPIPEAPKVEVAVNAPQIQMGAPTIATPIKPPDRILENVAPAADFGPRENPLISAPKMTPEEIARSVGRGGGGGGGTVGGTGSQPASLGEMQLLSDPQGVDFKPYLLRVLTVVRQKWFTIIPPEARSGRPGLTMVQFIIDRQGGVPKLVIANPSGTLAFDRAAVAAISASYPFPPLPAEYRGQEIRLQLAFTYNVKTVR